MGVAVEHGPHGVGRMAIGTRSQVWLYQNVPQLAGEVEPDIPHDAYLAPSASHTTGDIHVHEMAWCGEELWLVNTRFSCLATLSAGTNFVPRWCPPFIHGLAPEDRCHLNGMAIVDGHEQYVTALGESDTQGGWRTDKATGGVVIDVPTGAVVARGFAMPHSPRVHEGTIWLLDSGNGRLVTVDRATGRVEPAADVEGYARGLAFYKRFAFVGLSKARETSTFGGLPIGDRAGEFPCGVCVIDVRRREPVANFEFQGGVHEIFDVQLLRNVRSPHMAETQDDLANGTFVLPEQTLLAPPRVEKGANEPR